MGTGILCHFHGYPDISPNPQIGLPDIPPISQIAFWGQADIQSYRIIFSLKYPFITQIFRMDFLNNYVFEKQFSIYNEIRPNLLNGPEGGFYNYEYEGR